MEINFIEDKLHKIDDDNYRAIIEFIIEAVRSYPMLGMDDVDEYLKVVKGLLGKDINEENIKLFLDDFSTDDDVDFWRAESLNILLEAFLLMDFYGVGYFDVLSTIAGLA